MQERAWKVNLLVPVEDPSAVRGSFALLRDLTWPKGSVRLLGLGSPDGDRLNLDLPLLLGYKLLRNWDATMRLICVLDDRENVEEARRFLTAVLDLARIPRTRVMVLAEDYDTYVPQAPQADVNIFGLGRAPDFAFMRRMVRDTRSTCLFARDSGQESVLA